jgi:hypothetical protein
LEDKKNRLVGKRRHYLSLITVVRAQLKIFALKELWAPQLSPPLVGEGKGLDGFKTTSNGFKHISKHDNQVSKVMICWQSHEKGARKSYYFLYKIH